MVKYNVTFTPSDGLTFMPLERDRLIRDPNHDQREALNQLNDYFTPARSQSAPLDVQYVDGMFSPLPALKKSLVKMFREVIVDGNVAPEHGLSGIGALYAFMPVGQLPAEFVNFVKEHELEGLALSSSRRPSWYADPGKQRAVMKKFESLLIFGT